jgi:chromosomal replication initiator protein
MKEPAKLEELKRQYFKPEMLLIDDIQTFIDKPKIGDVFFDIFNYRNDHDKITVMTSDIHVDELRKINERVTSRLASGLVTQILPPDPSSIKEIINIKTST